MKESVNVLPYAPSQGTLGAEKKRWHAVYVDDVYKLDGGEVKSIDDIYASKSIIAAQNNSVAEVQAALAALRALIDSKADKSHGNHVPPLQPYAVNTYLASDGSFKEVKLADIDAPHTNGVGAVGTWHIDIDGNAATATLADQATLAIGLNVTMDPRRQATVVGVDNQKTFADTGVYLTTAPGELHATTFDGNHAQLSTVKATMSVTSPKFIGNLQGNADTATRATTSVVTLGNTTKAYITGHVNNALYYDSGVYLTTTSGQLRATSMDTDTLTSKTATLSSGTLTFKYGTYSGNLQMTSSNMLSSTVDFTAPRVFNAIWNDYAEFFECADAATEPGDIIARLPGKTERYGRAMAQDMVVGVHTDEFAHVIGGLPATDEQTVLEANKGKFIPVALAGRVHVKVNGPAKVGQWVVPSDEPGVGVAVDNPTGNVVGRVLVDKTDTGISRVRVLVK